MLETREMLDHYLPTIESADLYRMMHQCEREITEYEGRNLAWKQMKSDIEEELNRRFTSLMMDYKKSEQERKI